MQQAVCRWADRLRHGAQCGGAPTQDHLARLAAVDRWAGPERAIADRLRCHRPARLRHRCGARSCPPPRHRSGRSTPDRCGHGGRSIEHEAVSPHGEPRLAVKPAGAGRAWLGHCTIYLPSQRPAETPGLRAAGGVRQRPHRQWHSTTPDGPAWLLRWPTPQPGHPRPTTANRESAARPNGHARQSPCHQTRTARHLRRFPTPAAPRSRWASKPAPPAGTGWQSRPWPPPPVAVDRSWAGPEQRQRRYHHRRQNRAAGDRAAAATGAAPCHRPRRPRPAPVPTGPRAGWHEQPPDRPSARADRATR